MIRTASIVLGLLSVGLATAQTPCPNLLLQNGMQLVYKVEAAPPATYNMTGDYFKASAKEQQKIRENFYRNAQWTTDVQTNAVALQPGTDGSIEIISTVKRAKQPAAVSEYRSYCKGDTMVARPGYVLDNGGTRTTVTYYNETLHPGTDKPNGFNLQFEKAYPNRLEVGMQLPDQPTMFSITTGYNKVSFPVPGPEVSRTTTTHYQHNSYTGRYDAAFKTTESKYETVIMESIMESAVTSEVLLKNRMVKDRKEVTVSGRTYTAYLLSEESWISAPNVEVTSTNAYMMRFNKRFSDKMAKKNSDTMKKMLNANEQGYVVTRIDTWYIPGLGAYSITSYDLYGTEIGRLTLQEIKI
jgi:hypothetical protein